MSHLVVSQASRSGVPITDFSPSQPDSLLSRSMLIGELQMFNLVIMMIMMIMVMIMVMACSRCSTW